MMWNWTRLTVSVGRAEAITGKKVQLVGMNTIAALDPCPGRQCQYSGADGVAGVLAYSGMAFAPDVGAQGGLAVTGGGHSDYWGNEVYLFDFASSAWRRINAPSPAAAPDSDARVDLVHGEYADGSPMAAHTYNVLAVIPGGAKGLLLRAAAPAVAGNGMHSAAWSHVCDLATGRWSRFSTNAAPTDGYSVPEAVCYDAKRNRIWELYRGGFHDRFAFLDLGAREHMPVHIKPSNFGYNPCAALVPVHDLMLFITGVYGVSAGPILCAMDLTHPDAGVATLKLAGDEIPAQSSPPWGFDWDTTQDCGYVFGGDNDANHLYRIDPPPSRLLDAPWMVTKITLPSPMPKNNADGVYGHWRYVPPIKAFAYVSTVTNRVAIYQP